MHPPIHLSPINNLRLSLKLRLATPDAASGVRVVGTQALPEGYRPMLLRGGVLVCLTRAGSLGSVALDTHAPLQVQRRMKLFLVRV